MRYSVEYSDSAESDFDQIAAYLQKYDYDLDIINQIDAEIKQKLSVEPMNNLRLDNGIYKLQILRKNVIYYEIAGGIVRILNIRAGKMRKKVGE